MDFMYKGWLKNFVAESTTNVLRSTREPGTISFNATRQFCVTAKVISSSNVSL